MTNTTEIKVTRVDAMNICKELVSASGREDADKVIAVLDKLITSFSKRGESKADKAKAEENEVIRATIVDVLKNGRMRVSEITKAVNESLGTDYTSNKVSAQVTRLKDSNTITREVEKKIAYFSIS